MMRSTILWTVTLWALAGCAGISVSPNGGKFASPVSVSIYAGADIEIGSVRVMVDGADQSSAFVFSSPGTRGLDANLTLTPGTHVVSVTANVWNGLYRTYDPKSASATFEAGAPGGVTVNISPTAVALLPGGSVTINVTIARSGAFTGDVEIFDSDPTYGSGTSKTVTAPGTTGTLTSTARTDAWAIDGRRDIYARGKLYDGGLQDVKRLSFRIAHKVGTFTRAGLAAVGAGATVTSPDGQTTLHVDNGAPNTPRFEARFTRPTNSYGARVGFDPGTPVNGGAGFCASGAFGFVISGGSTTTPHTLTLVYMDDAYAKIPLTIPASSGNGAVVTPEVYFSRDCTVAVTVGADTQTQHAFRATVYDVNQRKSFCSLPFDTAASLQAELLAPAGDNQILRVTVDGQATSCPTF
jgi:hypothetical protein